MNSADIGVGKKGRKEFALRSFGWSVFRMLMRTRTLMPVVVVAFLTNSVNDITPTRPSNHCRLFRIAATLL